MPKPDLSDKISNPCQLSFFQVEHIALDLTKEFRINRSVCVGGY